MLDVKITNRLYHISELLRIFQGNVSTASGSVWGKNRQEGSKCQSTDNRVSHRVKTVRKHHTERNREMPEKTIFGLSPSRIQTLTFKDFQDQVSVSNDGNCIHFLQLL